MAIDEKIIISRLNSIFDELDREYGKLKNEFKDINNFSDTTFYEIKNNMVSLMVRAERFIHTYKSLLSELNDK